MFQHSDVRTYQDDGPALVLERYFSGHVKAHGILQNRRGRVIRRFDIDMHGDWHGDTGQLEESFRFYDGARQHRVWKITKIGEGRYVGRADDIDGEAHGTLAGNTVLWCYTMRIPVKGRTYRIAFDDWMFLMEDGVLLNRSYLKKFGIKVAELSIVMQKKDAYEEKFQG